MEGSINVTVTLTEKEALFVKWAILGLNAEQIERKRNMFGCTDVLSKVEEGLRNAGNGGIG